MTSRTLVLLSVLMAGSAITVAQSPPNSEQPPQQVQPPLPTQQRPSTPSPAPGQPSRGAPTPTLTPPAPAPPRREGQPINVKVEVTITDQSGGTQVLKKTVTVVTGDQMSGFIR